MALKPDFKFTPVRKGTQVIFLARLSYCHLVEPRAVEQGSTPKYSLSAIVSKDDTQTVEALKAAYKEAYEAGVSKVWKGTRPNPKAQSFKLPIKDGDIDKEGDEAYADSVFISANSTNKVAVLDRYKKPIDPSEAYSGCFALVSVNFFPFAKGSNGVAAGLNAVLKMADAEPLGGAGDGSQAFNEIEIPQESINLDDM